jgi:hypothetical protein
MTDPKIRRSPADPKQDFFRLVGRDGKYVRVVMWAEGWDAERERIAQAEKHRDDRRRGGQKGNAKKQEIRDEKRKRIIQRAREWKARFPRDNKDQIAAALDGEEGCAEDTIRRYLKNVDLKP